MRHALLPLLLLLLLGALLIIAPAAGQEPGEPTPGGRPELTYRALETADQTRAWVRELTALEAPVEAQKATLEALAVPGLAEIWSGRRVWRSRLEGAQVRLGPAATAVVNPHIAGFDVFTDDRGALLRMVSLAADPDQVLEPRLPDLEQARIAMERTANRYVGLPSEPPKITVDELLQRAHEQGWAPLDKAKEIRIKRVLQSRESVGEGTRPVWVINVRGIPPYPGRGPGARVSEVDRSHLRLVYDDEGTLLFVDNLMY